MHHAIHLVLVATLSLHIKLQKAAKWPHIHNHALQNGNNDQSKHDVT